LPERDLACLEDIRSYAVDALSLAGGKTYERYLETIE
jgi:hypothetical protein